MCSAHDVIYKFPFLVILFGSYARKIVQKAVLVVFLVLLEIETSSY